MTEAPPTKDSSADDKVFGLDPNIPVNLVIDDSVVSGRLWAGMSPKQIPGTQSIIVDCVAGEKVDDGSGNKVFKPGALDILFHPRLKIASVITDNNFPLTPTGPAKSTTRIKAGELPTSTETQKYNEVKEGAAGIMVVRLVRGGNLALESSWSKAELLNKPIVEELLALQQKDELKPLIEERFRDMPLIWNTAGLTNAKIASLHAAAEGKLLVPEDPRILDEEHPGYGSSRFCEASLGIEKNNVAKEGYSFLKEQGAKRMATLAREASLKPATDIRKDNTAIDSEQRTRHTSVGH